MFSNIVLSETNIAPYFHPSAPSTEVRRAGPENPLCGEIAEKGRGLESRKLWSNKSEVESSEISGFDTS